MPVIRDLLAEADQAPLYRSSSLIHRPRPCRLALFLGSAGERLDNEPPPFLRPAAVTSPS